MSKKKSALEIAQEKVQLAVQQTNAAIAELGVHTGELHDVLHDLQTLFDVIRDVPSEKRVEFEQCKAVRLEWKKQVERIDTDYKTAGLKNAGIGVAGAGAGVAVAALGPAAAMGIATSFGVASTGTAISALSGAAATNAALAWLGGGTLLAGGGGMAAGEAFLALAGPVGWAIAGAAALGSVAVFIKGAQDRKRLERVFTEICERDEKSYQLAIVEIHERIARIDDECEKLKRAFGKIKTFGWDYARMTTAQQYELGAYVNLMSSSSQLLVNPILGLQPKYSEKDYLEFISLRDQACENAIGNQNVIVFLANLLYKIEMDDKDKKILWKSFQKNKDFLETVNIAKRDFVFPIMETVFVALQHKYI